ncbi:unnamed protein product [Amoebophrya sp. A25]|nr:unnamed protein product [Amoebophrya sp. A25]|eukprot:GSA25T00007755001.1
MIVRGVASCKLPIKGLLMLLEWLPYASLGRAYHVFYGHCIFWSSLSSFPWVDNTWGLSVRRVVPLLAHVLNFHHTGRMWALDVWFRMQKGSADS